MVKKYMFTFTHLHPTLLNWSFLSVFSSDICWQILKTQWTYLHVQYCWSSGIYWGGRYWCAGYWKILMWTAQKKYWLVNLALGLASWWFRPNWLWKLFGWPPNPLSTFAIFYIFSDGPNVLSSHVGGEDETVAHCEHGGWTPSSEHRGYLLFNMDGVYK